MKPLLFALLFTLIIHPIVLLVKTVIKKKKEKTLSKLKADVWKVFSIYVRSKDKSFQDTVQCFTCDRTDHWKTMDAGHYIPKSTGGAGLYFHEKNVHPQCTGCNRFRHGNLTVYALRLQQKYGSEVLEELHSLRGQSWSKRELERLLIHYKDKIR
jgi:hypothetical protein